MPHFSAETLTDLIICAFEMERVTGIEPAYFAWEANVLPLNYTRPDVTCCMPEFSWRSDKPDTENTFQPAIIFNLKVSGIKRARRNCSATDFT